MSEISRTQRWIDGYKGLYAATESGEIVSFKAGSCGRLMRSWPNRYGYLRLNLTDSLGRKRQAEVHRLVASAVLGRQPKGAEVNHKNGDKADNRPSNLEWVSHRENFWHALSIGIRMFGPWLRSGQCR